MRIIIKYTMGSEKIQEELVIIKQNQHLEEQSDYSICITEDNGLEEIPLASENIDMKYYDMLSDKLKLLPKSMMEDVYSNGWGIILTNEDLAKMYFPDKYSKVQALTSYKQRLIVIGATDRYLDEAPLHEIGHVVEYINGKIGRTEMFINIYENEKDNFKSSKGHGDYARTNVQEYFAESFQEYIINPKQLQENCPMTYGYVGSIIEKYRQKDLESSEVVSK